MKKIIILLIVLLFTLPNLCLARSSVLLEWDCNCPGITGYIVYRTNEPGKYDPNNPVAIIPDPDIKQIIDCDIPDGIYYWVVTSYEKYIPAVGLDSIFLESDYSNEVRAKLKTVKPLPPFDNKIKGCNKTD